MSNAPTPRTDAICNNGELSYHEKHDWLEALSRKLEREIAEARAELFQCQSDRQREHDLRVKFAGEIELLQSRFDDADARADRHLQELTRLKNAPAAELAALRKDRERLPHTADGVPIFIGDTVYLRHPDLNEYHEDWICEQVVAVICGRSFECYEGDFTIGCNDFEAGNLDCYSIRGAAMEKAKS